MNKPHNRRGFTLLELGVLAALLGLGAGVLLPAVQRARDEAKQAVDLSHLRQLSMASVAYSADFGGAIATFSWHVGMPEPLNASPEAKAILLAAAHDGQAAAAQAMDILARRAEGVGVGFDPEWEPHMQHTPLVLLDYLAIRFPEPLLVAAGDEVLADLQQQPLGEGEDRFPVPPGAASTPRNRMVRFSSSFQFVPAIADPAQSQWPLDRRTSVAVVQHPDRHSDIIISEGARLRPQTWSQVHFPSLKVHMHVDADYYSDRVPLHWSHPQAKVTTAMFDGSVQPIHTIDMNAGWDPTQPANQRATTLLRVTPSPWERFEPIAAQTAGRMRWTRGGLLGIDTGGPEIRTGKDDGE